MSIIDKIKYGAIAIDADSQGTPFPRYYRIRGEKVQYSDDLRTWDESTLTVDTLDDTKLLIAIP